MKKLFNKKILILLFILSICFITSCEVKNHTHDYEETIVDATCTEQGFTKYSCKECDFFYVGNLTNALGHNASDWIIDTPATTTSAGKKHKECTRCGEIMEEETIPQLEEEHVHSYTSVVTEPTCTTQGYTTYTCSCGDTYKDNYVDATGHIPSDWIIDRPATTTEEGSKHKECTVCHETLESEYIDVIEESHVHSYTETVVDPTCTSKGYTLHVCECGDNYKTDETDMIDHIASDWIVDKEATTTEDGSKHKECTMCHKVLETKTINYNIVYVDEWKVTVTLKEDTPYKLGYNNSKDYFATGNMQNTYYGEVSTNADNCPDFYVEVVTGGYYLTTTVNSTKKYLSVTFTTNEKGEHYNYVYEDTASTVFEYKNGTFVTTVNEQECWIGSRGTYGTLSAYANSKYDSTASDSYVLKLYEKTQVEKEVDPDPDPSEYNTYVVCENPIADTAYLLGFTNNTNYYATGNMKNTYYGESTDNADEAIKFYIETIAGGFHVYTTINGSKKYVNCTISGTHYNFVYGDTADVTWTYANNYLECDLSGTACWIGSNGTYGTFAAFSKAKGAPNGTYYYGAALYEPGYDPSLDTKDDEEQEEHEVGEYTGERTYYHLEYYTGIESVTDTKLQSYIKNLMNSTMTLQSYGSARYSLATIDADPDVSGNIILFYSGESISGTWDGGKTWNREHVWCVSRSAGLFTNHENSSVNAGTDLHHIRPASASGNSSRGNKAFGVKGGSGTFYPGDRYIGDVARILFYMSVTYDLDIEETGIATSIEMLLEWNELDPVSEEERTRNEKVYQIQGNYNAFVDMPWLANIIFG